MAHDSRLLKANQSWPIQPICMDWPGPSSPCQVLQVSRGDVVCLQSRVMQSGTRCSTC